MILGAIVIVVVGMLVVNYFNSKRAGSVLSPNGEGSTTTEKTHTVVGGETLWSISEDLFGSGYNWTDIYNANGLKTDKIEVGQKLVIPEVSPKQPTSTKVQVAQDNSSSISGSNYTVIKGDSLWKIAVRAYGDGYKWVEIAKANNLKNPNLIHSGNVLILPR